MYSNDNTADNPTMNISGTGAQSMFYKAGTRLSGAGMKAGYYTMVYQGSGGSWLVTGYSRSGELDDKGNVISSTYAKLKDVAFTGNVSMSGTLTLSKTQDLSGTANNSPALIIGGAATGAHIEIDSNEIHAKANGSSVNNLYLNGDGGKVVIGNDGLSVKGGASISGDLYIGTVKAGTGSTASITFATVAPASSTKGQMYYNTKTNVFYAYDGSNWLSVTG